MAEGSPADETCDSVCLMVGGQTDMPSSKSGIGLGGRKRLGSGKLGAELWL